MSYFPQEIKTKVELQESTTNVPLSHDHVTTMNFGEFNIATYRHNTPREKYNIDASVFALPMPMQTPLLGKAEHHLKCYYVPFRTISPQWNAFVNKSPYIPANGNSPIQVQEMPYTTPYDMEQLIQDGDIAEVVADPTNVKWDYKIGSQYYKLKPFGRYTRKILNQLGYQIIFGNDKNGSEHIDCMGLLAAAKVYMDWYYSNAWIQGTTESIEIENLFKKDDITAYHVTKDDIKAIARICKYVWYNEDYFTAQWQNPMSPNSFASIGTIELTDITFGVAAGNEGYQQIISNAGNNAYNTSNTPSIHRGSIPNGSSLIGNITQYAIDSLKKMTDYTVRYAMAGVREVDRYLSRFGVLLASEKMKRSVYYGEQITPMEFGRIYSNAATEGAVLGDYAGNGVINSDNKEHKHWEIESDEYGIILLVSSIIPKIGYYQGIDRNNLHHEIETYFSGIFDQLGTQATSQAEVFVGNTDAAFNGDTLLKGVYGWIPRGAEYKTPRDRMTGDFVVESINTGTDSWHLFRKLKAEQFLEAGIVVSPYFCRMNDAEQYLRIFNETTEAGGDHFQVIYQFSADANIHAKPLYESYDFESEGKEIMLNGAGPKQN